MRREINVATLERQKRILYDLLQKLQVEEPEGAEGVSDPLQELWGLVDLCEDLLDAMDHRTG